MRKVDKITDKKASYINSILTNHIY